MPKPVTVPRWATDLTNNTAPSSGQMDTGWTPNQDGVSDYDNWFKYWVYKWLDWLNTGNVDVNNLTVAGATTYTGIANYSWTTGDIVLDPLGTGNTDGVHTVLATPSNLVAHVLHGMVAGTSGREIEIVNTNDTYGFYIVHNSGTAAVGQKLRLPYDWQLANASGYSLQILPRGSIRVRYHGADGVWDVTGVTGGLAYRCLNIPAIAASIPNGAAHTRSTSHIVIGGTGRITIPVTLPSRSILEKWNVYVKKNTTSCQIGAQLFSRNGNSDTENFLGTAATNSVDAPGYITLTDTPGTIIVDSNSQYNISFNPVTGGTTPSNDLLVSADVFAWIPA